MYLKKKSVFFKWQIVIVFWIHRIALLNLIESFSNFRSKFQYFAQCLQWRRTKQRNFSNFVYILSFEDQRHFDVYTIVQNDRIFNTSKWIIISNENCVCAIHGILKMPYGCSGSLFRQSLADDINRTHFDIKIIIIHMRSISSTLITHSINQSIGQSISPLISN